MEGWGEKNWTIMRSAEGMFSQFSSISDRSLCTSDDHAVAEEDRERVPRAPIARVEVFHAGAVPIDEAAVVEMVRL